MVINSCKDQIKTFGDQMQVFQGQLTLIKLSVSEDIIDNFLNQTLDPRRCRIFQRPTGSLDRVCEHD